MTVGPMRRPRIKPEHRPYRTVDGNIRIGSVIYGAGAEIEDPGGWVWTLTESLDGMRAPEAVIAEVTRRHPGVAAADVVTAYEQILDGGFVEDAGAPVPPELSLREQERYGRSMAFFRWIDLTPRTSPWDAQLRLRRSRVLLIGLGGTGGAVAQALVASGVGRLHCVDPDVVELSNLNRQPLYGENDIGRPKADAAVERLRSMNSDIVVTAERREVRGEGDLAELLADGRGCDLLVLAADRPTAIRRWANRACLAAEVPWLDGGYHGPLATVGVHVPGNGPCWECMRAGEVARRDLRLAPGEEEERASPRMPWNPVNAVSAGLSGMLMAHAALTLLTGAPPIAPGFRFGVNLMAPGDPVLDRFPRRRDCPACGDRA
ncbi:MAG: dinucleotide-utilizing enzyme [Streptomyces oryziradicis]|nr:dinucleotide-utilizing enzyme [Actinacidiphila oryziradicis]